MSTPRKTFYWARANAPRQAPTAATSMMRSLGISSALRVPGRRYANFYEKALFVKPTWRLLSVA